MEPSFNEATMYQPSKQLNMQFFKAESAANFPILLSCLPIFRTCSKNINSWCPPDIFLDSSPLQVRQPVSFQASLSQWPNGEAILQSNLASARSQWQKWATSVSNHCMLPPLFCQSHYQLLQCVQLVLDYNWVAHQIQGELSSQEAIQLQNRWRAAGLRFKERWSSKNRSHPSFLL